MKILGPKMKIAALTSILVFALGAAFAGTAAWFSAITAAWFSAITAVDQGGNSFPAKPMSGKFESMAVYPLNAQASDLSKMVFDVSETSYVERATVTDWDSKTVQYSKKKEFQMGAYDLLWPTHPILIVIHFGEIVTPSAGEPPQIQGESTVNEYLGSSIASPVSRKATCSLPAVPSTGTPRRAAPSTSLTGTLPIRSDG